MHGLNLLLEVRPLYGILVSAPLREYQQKDKQAKEGKNATEHIQIRIESTLFCGDAWNIRYTKGRML